MGRLFWIFVGAVGALYGRHKTKKTVDRYIPPAVSEKLVSTTKVAAGTAVKTEKRIVRFFKERRDAKHL